MVEDGISGAAFDKLYQVLLNRPRLPISEEFG
jgi:hypothetical protein